MSKSKISNQKVANLAIDDASLASLARDMLAVRDVDLEAFRLLRAYIKHAIAAEESRLTLEKRAKAVVRRLRAGGR